MFPQCGKLGKRVACRSVFRSAGSPSRRACTGSSSRRPCPVRAWTPTRSGRGPTPIIHDLAPRNRELLARRDELQAASTRSTASTPARPTRRPTPRSCARSATCSTSRPRSRSPRRTSTTRSPGSPDPSSSCRCSTRASPPTPPTHAGARSTTPSTAPTWSRARATSPPATATTRCAATRSSPAAGRFLDEHFPLATGSHADATSYAVDGDGLAVTLKGDVVRLADPAQLVGHRGDAAAPRGRAPRPPRAARRDPGRPRRRRSARPTRPASRTSCSSPPSRRSWTSRTPSPPSTPRTRWSATATGCSSWTARSRRRSPRAGGPSPAR